MLNSSDANQHCTQRYCKRLVTVNIATFDLQSSSHRVTSAPATSRTTQILNIVFLFCIFFAICSMLLSNLQTPYFPNLTLAAARLFVRLFAQLKKRIYNLLAFLQLPFQLHECYILLQCCCQCCCLYVLLIFSFLVFLQSAPCNENTAQKILPKKVQHSHSY